MASLFQSLFWWNDLMSQGVCGFLKKRVHVSILVLVE